MDWETNLRTPINNFNINFKLLICFAHPAILITYFYFVDFYKTLITYDHAPPSDKTTNSLNFRTNTINLLKAIATEEEYRESRPTSAERFFELVISFRHLKSTTDVEAVVSSVDLTKEHVR